MGYFTEDHGCRSRLPWKYWSRWKRKAWHRENDLRRANGLPPLSKT